MTNLFLSHCSEDKAMIDTIAQKLLTHFPKENIFYDAWSMQPGENFLEGMEKGLANCEYFFLFMSETSLKKPMVRLEWHSALLDNLKGENAFIPIRVDNISPPQLLTSTLYIDMYNRGIDQTVADIQTIATGGSTYNPQSIPQFRNLTVDVTKNGNAISVDILAKRLAEPDNSFAFWVSDGTKPSTNGLSMTNTGTLNDSRTVSTVTQNHTITPSRPNKYTIKPLAFPVEIEIFHILGEQLIPLWKGKIE